MSTNGTTAHRGVFGEGIPYVRFGEGPENLLILPGITLHNEPPNRLAAWTYRLGFGQFAKAYTVYVLNRRRGMPTGYTAQDMAADYGRIAEEDLGPSHVMGFSTGGTIAQHLALDHPASVLSLTLVVSAARLSGEGREICERGMALARERHWRELHADMASVTVTAETNKRLARGFMSTFGRFVLGAPAGPSDFLVTLQADLDHDTSGRLGETSAPTLVIGGSEDPFFTEGLLHETAEGIPDATLRVYGGVGHGVPKEHKRQYETDALAFLNWNSGQVSAGDARTAYPRGEGGYGDQIARTAITDGATTERPDVEHGRTEHAPPLGATGSTGCASFRAPEQRSGGVET